MKFIFMFIIIYTGIIAHPHVFMEVFTKPIITNNIIQGISFTIIIDEMNSLIFLETYDINNDKTIDKKEFINLSNENFLGITDKDSHFHIRYGNSNIALKNFKLNKVFINDSNLIYEIFIPLNIIIEKRKNLYIGIYDPKYYYDYDYSKDYFLEDQIDTKFILNFNENKSISFYMGNLNPLEYEVIF